MGKKIGHAILHYEPITDLLYEYMNQNADIWLEKFLLWIEKRDEQAAKEILGELRKIAKILAKSRFSAAMEAKTWEDLAVDAFFNLTARYRGKRREDFLQKGRSNFRGLMAVAVRNLFLNLRSFRKNKPVQMEPLYGPDENMLENAEAAVSEASVERGAFSAQVRQALKSCFETLRNLSEFRWLAIRAWIYYHPGVDWEDAAPPFPGASSAEGAETETQRIISAIRMLAASPANTLGLTPETLEKAAAPLNENSMKSDILRARDFMKKCLSEKGISP